MFNTLFKKSKIAVASTVMNNITLSNNKNYPKEVLEIHHEFEVAADKLLEDAYEIINSQPKVNKSKIERLSKFGFKQVKEVVESTEIIKKTELSEEIISLVQYYKVNYPYNKFITEEQVKEICHKYNLVCGDVSRFKGFVPDNNLQDIERFRIKPKDDISMKLGEMYVILNDFSIININNIEENGYKINKERTFKFVKENYLKFNNYAYIGNLSSDAKTTVPGWGKVFQYRLDNLTDVDIIKAVEINNKGFKICAPVKDMDISGLELKEDYKLEAKKHIPDPVVLQPVKGGYLVVTAWGDEASDPLVVNETMN